MRSHFVFRKICLESLALETSYKSGAEKNVCQINRLPFGYQNKEMPVINWNLLPINWNPTGYPYVNARVFLAVSKLRVRQHYSVVNRNSARNKQAPNQLNFSFNLFVCILHILFPCTHFHWLPSTGFFISLECFINWNVCCCFISFGLLFFFLLWRFLVSLAHHDINMMSIK